MRFTGSHCGKNWDVVMNDAHHPQVAEAWCPLCGHKFPMKEV